MDERASHVTLFVQALLLELAGELRFATQDVLAITFILVCLNYAPNKEEDFIKK